MTEISIIEVGMKTSTWTSTRNETVKGPCASWPRESTAWLLPHSFRSYALNEGRGVISKGDSTHHCLPCSCPDLPTNTHFHETYKNNKIFPVLMQHVVCQNKLSPAKATRELHPKIHLETYSVFPSLKSQPHHQEKASLYKGPYVAAERLSTSIQG